jgi:hypothetical protein
MNLCLKTNNFTQKKLKIMALLNTKFIAFLTAGLFLICLGIFAVYNGYAGSFGLLQSMIPDASEAFLTAFSWVIVGTLILGEIVYTEVFLQEKEDKSIQWYNAVTLLFFVLFLAFLDWHGGQIKGEEYSQKTEIAKINQDFGLETAQKIALLNQTKNDSTNLVAKISNLNTEITSNMDSVVNLRTNSERILQEIDYLGKANASAIREGKKPNISYLSHLQEKSSNIRKAISEKSDLIASLQKQAKLTKEGLTEKQSEISSANIAILNGRISNSNIVATKIDIAQTWGKIRAILTTILTLFFTYLVHKLYSEVPYFQMTKERAVAKTEAKVTATKNLEIKSETYKIEFIRFYEKDLNRLASLNTLLIEAFEVIYSPNNQFSNKIDAGLELASQLGLNSTQLKNRYNKQANHEGYANLKGEAAKNGLNLLDIISEIRTQNQTLIAQ